jgi:hypothetical protein
MVLAEVQGAASGSPFTVRWDVKHANGVRVTIDPGPGAEEEHDAPTDVGWATSRCNDSCWDWATLARYNEKVYKEAKGGMSL